jgi:hypothetical protein
VPRPEGAPWPDGASPRPRGPRPPPPDWWQQPDRYVDRFELDASGYRFIRPSPIVVGGQLVGVVVVPAQAPFGYLLRRYAPILTVVAAGVMIVGTLLTSFMIFGPARRRLRAVEAAARRLGGGDLSARAPIAAATKSPRWRARSTRWLTIWPRAPRRWRHRTARGGSCSPTSRTSSPRR